MTVLSVSSVDTSLPKFALALQQLAAGRSNATGRVTLTPNATSTTVSAINCAAGSAVFLFQTSANAAAALATTYVGAVANRSFTLIHASSAQTDRTFFFVCLG